MIFGHLSQRPEGVEGHPVSAARPGDRDDDVVVVSALRTPITKANRGGFKNTPIDELLAAVYSAVIKDSGINPSMLGDIVVGNVNAPQASSSARIAQFYSGVPETVPTCSVNRQCSSGLVAAMNIASAIKAGQFDIGMAAGVETMSLHPLGKSPEGFVLSERIGEVQKALDCLIPMGITSENVAEKYGVTRREQDQMAYESHMKALKAQQNGLFDQEIVPVSTKIVDKDGSQKSIIVSKDEGIRPSTTVEGLGKLRPAFKEGGSTTAGNASQVSDGAAAVILARRSAARQHGLPVLGTLRSFALAGVPPDVMGIGPAYAIPEALRKAGLTVDDIAIYEINEAFASQAKYCVDKLGIPMEKVNPKGGAIALGHPVGCTGARQIGTLLHELKRRGDRAYGVVSMCMGTGMGAAAVFEYAP